ncbi:hypothetical protein ACVWXW_000597 [Thermostichus sp. MS-CIW-30]
MYQLISNLLQISILLLRNACAEGRGRELDCNRPLELGSLSGWLDPEPSVVALGSHRTCPDPDGDHPIPEQQKQSKTS